VKDFMGIGEGKLVAAAGFRFRGLGKCYRWRMDWDALIEEAWKVRERAHAPYSRFQVGAALLAKDGRVFTGCTVENLSYGLTMCAERVAIGAAVAAGVTEFQGVAVVADTAVPISPCGACRQVLSEFGVPQVMLANREESVGFTMEELFPRASTGILDRP
jgi:cytidine deaminase